MTTEGSMAEAPFQETYYPSVGRCIYCGEETATLTDEHMIPLALQGALVMLRASCEPCREVTSRFETQFIKTAEHFRVRAGIRRRKPNKRKKAYWFSASNVAGGKRRVLIPANEVPSTLMLFKLDRANILQGRPPFDPTFKWLPVLMSDGEELKRAMEKYGWDGSFQIKALINQFVRMLAKIGHSYAVSQVGLEAFTPLCLDIILGRDTNYSYVIGGSLDLKDEPDSTSDHFLALGLIDQPHSPKLLVACIRLFQQMRGAPHYHVVVGRVQNVQQIAAVERYFANGSTMRQSFHGI